MKILNGVRTVAGLALTALITLASPVALAHRHHAAAAEHHSVHVRHAATIAARHGRHVRITSAARRKYAVAHAHRSGVSRAAYQPHLDDDLDGPRLIANVALAYNENSGEIVYAKNTDHVLPIASITKLMTAVVVLDSKQDMDEILTMAQDDVVNSRGERSRLNVGYGLARSDMLRVALLVSDNRAAEALARNFPGGRDAFIERMNSKARALGMTSAHFYDASGLNPGNVASPTDLVRLVQAAYQFPLLRSITSTVETEILPLGAVRPLMFRNTDQLVRSPEWQIGISKTGFTNAAGHCLTVQAMIAGEPYVLVVMESTGNRAREADAQRLKRWIEYKAGVYTSSS